MSDEKTEQLVLVPHEPLELEAGTLEIELLDHEEVPTPTKQLVDSIGRFGLLQPILVRETHVEGFDSDGIEHGDYVYDVVDGRRRLAACRLLGHKAISVMIAETNLAIADVATLATNATRTANPVAEYEAIERLTKMGATVKDISGATGMAQGTIKARQRLLNLVPELREAFRSGKITASIADGAAKLPVVVQKELIYPLAENGKITATDLHEVRQARTQAAMQADLFDNLGEGVELATEAEVEPIEAVLVRDIQSVIERLPDYIAKSQRSIVNALSWSAARLLDLSIRSATDELQSAYDWDSGHPERDEQISTFLPKGELVREIDTKYTDAPVEQPNRVFTLARIEEPDISTSDLPAGNPPPRKPRKNKKEKASQLKEDIETGKVKFAADDEDAFIEGFVG